MYSDAVENLQSAYGNVDEKFDTIRDIKIGDELRITTKSWVSSASENPHYAQWCQFKINTKTTSYIDDYIISQSEISYFVNGASLGDYILSSREGAADRYMENLFFALDSFGFKMGEGNEINRDFFKLSSCKIRNSNGFLASGEDTCFSPKFHPTDRNEAVKSMFAYLISCSSTITAQRNFAKINQERENDLEKIVLDNPEFEVEIRKAVRNQFKSELSLPSVGLSNIQGVGTYYNITNLNLSRNNISDISPLKRIYELRAVDLSRNNIEDISALAGSKKIFFLNLSHNNISDISILKDFEQLKELDLRGNPISDLSSIRKLMQDPDVKVLVD
jgi:Leucine-rich repeat (LRR) protein